MKTIDDLRRQLAAIDRRGYPAYKSLRGAYDMGGFALSIDHVQGDPFAAPSQLSVRLTAAQVGIPAELIDATHRRVAVEDRLIRRFSREAERVSHAVRGSGKSGLIATSRPGPEVLQRSACEVAADGRLVLRFEAGFPAHGRTVDARGLERMLCELVPACAKRALACDTAALAELTAAVELADDQLAIRRELERRGLVAFVADGSVLPRASGSSSLPMEGALPFASPASLRVALDLPHRGATPGMAIKRGITLIVGGGYHGKSTLLKALQDGVYDHVAGDGRELVICDAGAVKLRAEDGRPVHAVDISPFIGELPDGRDTGAFSTSDASGSTSQAAALVEAYEAGSRVLLVDEDTSATNFMVRDALMETVVARDCEPITPFVERLRDLWERAGMSCVIVAGSSGAFFSVADMVIQMDRYAAYDITDRAHETCRSWGGEVAAAPTPLAMPDAPRSVPGVVAATVSDAGGRAAQGRGAGGGRSRAAGRPPRIKVRVRGLDELQVGSGMADLRLVEQLVDPEQTAALAQLIRAAGARGLLDGSHTLADAVAAAYDNLREHGWNALAEHGEAGCGLALPRPQELFACLNRWRQ